MNNRYPGIIDECSRAMEALMPGKRAYKLHDIKRILCEALDMLSIPWTRPSERDIAIYRKDAVARLDEFIGPKG